MAKKISGATERGSPSRSLSETSNVVNVVSKSSRIRAGEAAAGQETRAPKPAKPSALLDTRVVYCGDNLEQLAKLPDGPCRTGHHWGETKEKRAFEDRHENTKAYIGYMRPRCVQLARVLKQTGSFYYHCDWHASHYVK